MSSNEKPVIGSLDINNKIFLSLIKPFRNNRNSKYDRKKYSKYIWLSAILCTLVVIIHFSLSIKELNKIKITKTEVASSFEQQKNIIEDLTIKISQKQNNKLISESQLNNSIAESKYQESKIQELKENITQSNSKREEAQRKLNILVYEKSDLEYNLLIYSTFPY